MAKSEYIMIIIKNISMDKVKEMRKTCEFDYLTDILKYLDIQFSYDSKVYKSFSFETKTKKLAKEFIGDWLRHVEYEAKYFVKNYYITDILSRVSVHRDMKNSLKTIEVTDIENNMCDLIVYTEINDKDCNMLYPINVRGHMRGNFKQAYKTIYN